MCLIGQTQDQPYACLCFRAPARGATYVTSFLQNWLFGAAEISKLSLSLYKLSLSLCEFKLSLCELSLSLEFGGAV
jgi:hypothetical protein